MNTAKDSIRKRLKMERQKLSEADTMKWSEKIAASCIELTDWENIKTMHTYVPVTKEHEPDGWYLLEYCWQNYPNITTAVPVKNKQGDYDGVVVGLNTEWYSRGIRIPRPLGGEKLSKDFQFDVIFVPMLGFDDSGHRLGHGKGWYDRFLATQPNALKVGMCYEFGFIKNGLPHEPHDVPLDFVVTEKAVRKI